MLSANFIRAIYSFRCEMAVCAKAGSGDTSARHAYSLIWMIPELGTQSRSGRESQKVANPPINMFDDPPDCEHGDQASEDLHNFHKAAKLDICLNVSFISRQAAVLLEVLKKLILLNPSLIKPLVESLRILQGYILDGKPAPVNVCERSFSALNV